MQNPENATHKIHWYFELKTDHLFSARQTDLVIINKKNKNLPNILICRSGLQQAKIKGSEKIDNS